MKAVGLDIGTTSISAVVLEQEESESSKLHYQKGLWDSHERTVLEARTVLNESFIPSKNHWERIQEPEEILCRAKSLLDGLLRDYPDVKSIGLTGQMHGIVYLNQEGQAISCLYTWQDGRGSLPEFNGRSLTDLIKEQAGFTTFSGYGLVTHLYHVKKRQVPEGSVSICTIADYLGMRLVGRTEPLVHVSNGAGFGFFDSEQGCFLEDTIRKMGMDPEILPKLSEQIVVLGEYCQIPVTIAIGDNQASFLGSVGIREDSILLNMGTGGQVSVLSKEYYQISGIETRPLIDGYRLLVGASLCGGKAYGVLEQFFRSYAVAAGAKDGSQYLVMEQLARAGQLLENRQAGSQMQVSTVFDGTRVNPAAKGSITGIRTSNFTPEGLTFGVLRGMAQELFDLYNKIHEKTGITAKQVIASGNGLRKNAVLQDIFSQMFQTRVIMAPYQEEAACGSGISSLRGIGYDC